MKLISLLLVLALIGCQSGPGLQPNSPAQIVYVAEGAELEALALANQYKRLPVCPTAPLCHTDAVVMKLQVADVAAAVALTNAEKVVRDPNAQANAAQQAALAAKAAVDALVAITSTLKVK